MPAGERTFLSAAEAACRLGEVDRIPGGFSLFPRNVRSGVQWRGQARQFVNYWLIFSRARVRLDAGDEGERRRRNAVAPVVVAASGRIKCTD